MREKIYSNISCLFWAVLKRNSAKFIEYDKNYCCNSNKNYCNESPRYCSAVSSLLLHAVNTVYNHFHKSNNLQYNMLVRCFTGTTDSATKHYFFMISLGHFGQKKIICTWNKSNFIRLFLGRDQVESRKVHKI
jgi:hypothetical protein